MRPVALVVLAFLLAGCVQVQVADPNAGTDTAQEPVRTPRLSIDADPTFSRIRQPVHFAVRAAGLASDDALASARWTFGDGTTGTGLEAEHAYARPGSYQVTVRATTVRGAVATAAEGIEVLNLGSVAAAAPTGPPADVESPVLAAHVTGSRVRFSFQANYTPELVHWSFGDGATSNLPSPEHTYVAKGTYNVTLRAMVSAGVVEAWLPVEITQVTQKPRVVVGLSDSGINPYHEVYYRPAATAHPCTYVAGYTDCSIPALNLSVGPDLGSYGERFTRDRAVWASVKPMTWYWIPRTTFIAVHCPEPYTGDARDLEEYANPICILDDTQTHGTQTTSSVLTEVPDALLVFNEGSDSSYLAEAPVAIDIESNSWGSLAPLYGGLVMGPTGQQVCHDSIESPTSLKFRSAGNNGPVPNLGDCWRNGYRTYSVSGGYPDGSHGQLSGSTPDFASYWCRPVAQPATVDSWEDACGTSFAAPTAAGAAAATLLELRRLLDFVGGSSTTEVAPGVTHEAFLDALASVATYEPEPRDGFPEGSVVGPATSTTPWFWWGWGWLDAQVVPQALGCVTGTLCPDNKSPEAWAFNDARRSFAADGDPM